MTKLYLNKIFLLTLLFYFSTTYSEIFKSIDEDGNVIFTDKKPLTYSEEMELEEVQTTISDKSLNSSEINHTDKKNENALNIRVDEKRDAPPRKQESKEPEIDIPF